MKKLVLATLIGWAALLTIVVAWILIDPYSRFVRYRDGYAATPL